MSIPPAGARAPHILIATSAAATFLLLRVAVGAAGSPAAAKPAGTPVKGPAATAAPAPKPAGAPAGDGTALFEREIRPILVEACVSCHSGENPQGGLKFTSRSAILKGGASGPAVAADAPDGGTLLPAVHYKGRKMPPRGKLPQKQIAALERWVKLGMPWPEGEHASMEPKGAEAAAHAAPQVTPETMKFWAFQPVRRPAVPEGAKNPVDAFILKRLKTAGLAPNPRASRETLIRRAYYDLTGLPPSAEEVAAFVSDPAPDAWEKVVDRLLASPHYGEKWGRHWLDLVRFAETNSYERDGTKPNAWRYRDYVIKSFNEDKPYDEFIREQLAGDEMAPRTPERLIATGYYRLGIWDDEPADPEQALYDDLDDIASTTGQVFLGMTVGCARCHDHKIDPLPQKDYYQFLAFFSGVRRYGVRSAESVAEASLRPIVPEAEQQKYRDVIAAHMAKVQANREQIQAIEAKVEPDLSPVEKEEFRTEPRRVPILKLRVPHLLSQEEFDRYVALREARRELFRNQPPALDSALCVTEVGPKPRDTYVLLRGNPHSKGEKVEPAFLSVLAPPKPEIAPSPFGDTSGRRLALARWIASRQNPLTARVMANRVWQYHFGRGLVRSSSNFGFQGDKPTHPELLDWLASYFVAGDGGRGPGAGGKASEGGKEGHPARGGAWSIKKLHRLVMLSEAYQRSSRGSTAALKKDPENDLFWRFDMRRLQAEEIRDSILAVNGTLNLKQGGPSIYPDIPEEVLAGQSMPGAGWGKSTPEEQARRSVYIFVKRSLAVPLIAAFDGPETDFTCSARFATTQPTQALGMLNSEWTNEQARIFARLLKQKAGDRVEDQVRLGLRRVLQREPTAAELKRGLDLIASLSAEDSLKEEEALAAFCTVALNLNEFIYLD